MSLRQRFETWAAKEGYDLASPAQHPTWQYGCSVTQELWWCWQAASITRLPWQLELADALDCAWNPAVMAERDGQGPGGVLAGALAAVATRLREQATPPSDQTPTAP